MARRILLLLLLVAGGLAAHYGWTYQQALGRAGEPLSAPPPRHGLVDKDYEMFRRLVDVMDQVEQHYVDQGVTREVMLEAAIRGVIRGLDQHSNYISPKDEDRFRTSIDQKFGGIGIQVGVRNNFITVISPIVGSPAYKAGVQTGDQIVKIEGKSAEGITIDEAVQKLKGEEGTEVTFTIRRPSTDERKVIKVKRAIIRLKTVLGDTRKDDDSWDFMLDKEKRIGYIRVTAFSGDTARALRRAVRELTNEGLRGLIIDLRFNPGGLLRSAVEISDMFIDEGVIVSVKNRAGREQAFKATKLGTFKGFPMAILVNRASASASEVVSACLQDHKRALIVGERTYGKASVQSVVELQGGGALKLTTASYHRPSGENIHRPEKATPEDKWGVMPDVGYNLRLSLDELGKLMEYRRDRDVVRAKGVKPEASDFVDKQLQKAVEYLNTQLAKAE